MIIKMQIQKKKRQKFLKISALLSGVVKIKGVYTLKLLSLK